MDFKEKYKIEKGFDVDVEIGCLSVIYYNEDYVKWLEKQLRIGAVSGSLHCPKCNTVNVVEDNNSDLIWCYECEKCYDR